MDDFGLGRLNALLEAGKGKYPVESSKITNTAEVKISQKQESPRSLLPDYSQIYGGFAKPAETKQPLFD